MRVHFPLILSVQQTGHVKCIDVNGWVTYPKGQSVRQTSHTKRRNDAHIPERCPHCHSEFGSSSSNRKRRPVATHEDQISARSRKHCHRFRGKEEVARPQAKELYNPRCPSPALTHSQASSIPASKSQTEFRPQGPRNLDMGANSGLELPFCLPTGEFPLGTAWPGNENGSDAFSGDLAFQSAAYGFPLPSAQHASYSPYSLDHIDMPVSVAFKRSQ